MIETALPVEGAPRAEPGPYAVTSEAAFGSPFVAKNCSLCTNSNWDVKSKGLAER